MENRKNLIRQFLSNLTDQELTDLVKIRENQRKLSKNFGNQFRLQGLRDKVRSKGNIFQHLIEMLRR